MDNLDDVMEQHDNEGVESIDQFAQSSNEKPNDEQNVQSEAINCVGVQPINNGTKTLPPNSNQNTNKSKKKRKKIIIITILALILVPALIVAIVGGTNNNSSSDNDSKSVVIPTKIKNIMDACSADQEQAEEINSVLEGCSITILDSIEHDDMLDNMFNDGDCGYRITSQGINNIILYLNSDKKVYSIRYSDVDLYANGVCYYSFTSFYLTNEQKAYMQTYSKKYVKEILKSPKSADFSWLDWSYAIDYKTNLAEVSSYVDADNSFGVSIRTYFKFVFHIEGDQYTLVYFKFGDDVIVNNLNLYM